MRIILLKTKDFREKINVSINLGIYQFLEKLDLKIKLALFTYFFRMCFDN